ncbi:hypothetical protein [Vibrio spartinae]|uniref:Uncharacterized protein n=1 Tax=Vibrio spartinae TaxID=1918945 RepID=A0A1N6M9M3_9VIBR|nr:hypothetical protein [Vibrio spartinae]SIO96093.1 hypothetical protein VSP9026_03853 [Vibrio spartinae]
MNDLEIEKSVYRFYHNDEIKTLDELPKMRSDGLITQEEYDHRMAMYQSWLDSEEYNERTWRNTELQKTDYMLIADATYGGSVVADTNMLQEVIDYRDRLRKYNLRDETRPTRPEWYTG